MGREEEEEGVGGRERVREGRREGGWVPLAGKGGR